MPKGRRRTSNYTPIVEGARTVRRAVCRECFEDLHAWWCQPESEIGDRCLAGCETETGRPRLMVGRLFYICIACGERSLGDPLYWLTPSNGGSVAVLREHIAGHGLPAGDPAR